MQATISKLDMVRTPCPIAVRQNAVISYLEDSERRFMFAAVLVVLENVNNRGLEQHVGGAGFGGGCNSLW